MIALLALGACSGLLGGAADSGTDSGTADLPDGPALETVSYSAETNGQGRHRVEIDVPRGVVSFQLTAESENFVVVESVTDPDGRRVVDAEDWVGTERSLTQSFYINRQTMAFDWPVREADGPLTPGTWTVWLAVVNGAGSGRPRAPLDVTVTTKFDPDPTEATIGVQIVYAEGVDEERQVVDAVEAAVERWRKVWADQGITLAEHYESSRLDPLSSFYFEGDPKVENLAERKAPGELQLIVSERVVGDPWVLGIAASIPGTVEPTPDTFVILSWLSHAGPDGAFSDEDVRMMGETMAHEIGHYIGLFHPVEVTYRDYDALDDTDECSSAVECEDAMGRNLMFPYPLCTVLSCQAQGQLTGEQAGVVHQQVSAL